MPRSIPILLAVAVAAGLAACHGSPPRLEPASLRTPEARAAAAGDYWRSEAAPRLRDRGRRVAVLEVVVELVTERMEVPPEGDPAAVDPLADTGPAGGRELTGLVRRRTAFGPDLLDAIGRDTATALVEVLEERGHDVLGAEVVTSTDAWADLPIVPDGQAAPRPGGLDFVGSDVGRVRRLERRVAPGWALVAAPRDGSVERAERAILDGVGADVGLRLRLRVGVYRGRAAVERGSEIAVITAADRGRLVAHRSLVSAEIVTGGVDPGMVLGEEYVVDAPLLRAALRELTPVALDMALEVAGR
ncbi:MAG: hypothetical protein ACYTG1_02485 [Planctomycetota bacterium]|jgi:hypothetical protein